jgi:glutamate racemase
MTIPSVLVLDSGVGGLSITGEIRTRCPSLHIDYIADLAAFPYGTKPEDHIVERITKLIEHAVGVLAPSIIVIACNTASTVALTAVRQIVAVPVVGVVPAIKPAAQLSETGVIGVLATEGTINRTYTHNLIQEFAHNRIVVLHGSARLVELAEQKLRHGSVDMQSVRQELLPLIEKAPGMDTVVLACTHFPLLKEEFMRTFPKIKFWVDSGSAIASRVESLLPALGLGESGLDSAAQTNTFYITSTKTHYAQASLERYLGHFREDFISIL